MSPRSLCTVFTALVLCTAGCGDDAGPTMTCRPGEAQACVGAGGCAGGQVCSDDGLSFGACDCGGVDAGDPPADAGDDGGGDGGRIDDGGPPRLPIGCDALPDGTSSVTYILSVLQIPSAVDDEVVGFDLDGMDSGMGSTDPSATCEELNPDYSWPAHDVTGVDNSFQRITSALEATLPTGVTIEDELSSAIAGGSVLRLLEVTGIDDRFDDDAVTVRIYRASVAGGGLPALGGDDLITPGQTFDATLIDERPGSLSRGVLSSSFATIDLEISATLSLHLPERLAGAELRAYLCDGRVVEGGIGGAVSLDRLEAAYEARMTGTGPTFRALLDAVADLTPSAADPSVCNAISMAYGFAGVAATRAP